MSTSDLPETDINQEELRKEETKPEFNRVLFLNVGVTVTGLLVLGILLTTLPEETTTLLQERLQTFTTIFLGIFIEAVPFLLAGSLVSGVIEIYVKQESLARFIPRRPLPAALVGSLLGFVFPVCECGVVPVTRRLYQKGMPLSVGAAFLLSAPVVNPVVLASTYVAFGWGPVFYGRFIFSILIAFITGLLFTFAKPEETVLPQQHDSSHHHHGHDHDHDHDHPPATSIQRLQQSLVVAGDDFMDMVRYLIIGSMMAAAMQTFVPQSTLLALGSGPITSVVAMMVLAFVLSICSTVDAFLALSFAGTFTTGSILSFLVFGPMVDIKSALMFLGVFRRRVVVYLILIPMMLTLLITIFINLNVGW